MHPFPAKNRKEARERWQKLINRSSPTRHGKMFTIKPKMRVCSDHFPDHEPAYENLYPILKMGYDASEKLKKINPSNSRRKLSFSNISEYSGAHPDQSIEISTCSNESDISTLQEMPSLTNVTPMNIQTPLFDLDPPFVDIQEPEITDHNIMNEIIADLKFQLEQTQTENGRLNMELSNSYFISNVLKSQLVRQKQLYKNLSKKYKNITMPVSEKLITSDKSCEFYTGIRTISEFNELHDIIAPFNKRRWRGVKKTTSAIVRKYKKKPKSFGPDRKLCSKDEFCLFLMKLRLGLLNQDLADRFGVSVGLISAIVNSWVKVTAKVLKSVIFIPEMEKIQSTLPDRFKTLRYNDVHSILDCTEFFIETPKNLDLQRVTWSDYKHHNTLKALVCVAPNSSIIFKSRAYGGSISDKEITVRSGYLDKVPKYSRIMYDKGFKLHEECSQRFIYYCMPPGRKGAAQMTPAEVKKTKEIANLRTLVEQVIRRMKTFRILANEYPISMLKLFDDIVTICSALSNFRKPIYLD